MLQITEMMLLVDRLDGCGKILKMDSGHEYIFHRLSRRLIAGPAFMNNHSKHALFAQAMESSAAPNETHPFGKALLTEESLEYF